jgi:hypothetical protein
MDNPLPDNRLSGEGDGGWNGMGCYLASYRDPYCECKFVPIQTSYCAGAPSNRRQESGQRARITFCKRAKENATECA